MDIKEQIKSRCGTISKFVDMSPLSFYKVYRAIDGQQPYASDILNYLESVKPVKKWDSELCKQVKCAIFERYETASNFSKESGISMTKISFAKNGKFKTVTPTNKVILDKLNIDYESR